MAVLGECYDSVEEAGGIVGGVGAECEDNEMMSVKVYQVLPRCVCIVFDFVFC